MKLERTRQWKKASTNMASCNQKRSGSSQNYEPRRKPLRARKASKTKGSNKTLIGIRIKNNGIIKKS
jgi:hypothetical protein